VIVYYSFFALKTIPVKEDPYFHCYRCDNDDGDDDHDDWVGPCTARDAQPCIYFGSTARPEQCKPIDAKKSRNREGDLEANYYYYYYFYYEKCCLVGGTGHDFLAR